MKPPQTRYTKLGDDSIAYQVVGDGPIDLLYVPANGESVDVRWEWPPYEQFLRRLASFSRLIMFDRRGSGASDPITEPGLPLWEEWANDARAVLDAVGSKRAAVLGLLDSGPSAILFAATEPERTQALILYTTSAFFGTDVDYPWGNAPEVFEPALAFAEATWGTEEFADAPFFPRDLAADQSFRTWLAKLNRSAMTPRAQTTYLRALTRMDVRTVLPSVTVPTLVMQKTDALFFTFGQGKYLADHIPGATFAAISGMESAIYVEATEEIIGNIQGFLTGVRPAAFSTRALAAILFTDIVGATEQAVALGDQKWRGLLESHDAVARTIIEQFGGRLVKHTGDGVLATFDGPGRAIRCATALRDALLPLGIEIRAGLHTGEIELMGEDVGGIGVHVAARVLGHAQPGELLVSAAVPMLVAGSGIEFEDRGMRALKGVPDEWQLYAVKAS